MWHSRVQATNESSGIRPKGLKYVENAWMRKKTYVWKETEWMVKIGTQGQSERLSEEGGTRLVPALCVSHSFLKT